MIQTTSPSACYDELLSIWHPFLQNLLVVEKGTSGDDDDDVDGLFLYHCSGSTRMIYSLSRIDISSSIVDSKQHQVILSQIKKNSIMASSEKR